MKYHPELCIKCGQWVDVEPFEVDDLPYDLPKLIAHGDCPEQIRSHPIMEM